MPDSSLTALLGTRLPILQGGMFWLATAELAAAVCNAGALGTVSPCAGMAKDGEPLENLERQIAEMNRATREPFAVNVLLDLPIAGLLLDRAVEVGVKVLVTAAGDPRVYTPMLKARGVRVLHVVSSVSQARRAEEAGADAVVVQGAEAGGRQAPNALPLLSLLPQVAEAVRVPAVAAGGIVDARGVRSALALGARGVQAGTRLIATHECAAHPSYKQAILEAGDEDTVLIGHDAARVRALNRGLARRLRELEVSGAAPEALRAARRPGGSREAQLGGRFDLGEAYCGASAGLIREILPARAAVEELARGFSPGADAPWGGGGRA
ncbi:MAG: nitronate monooxygenase [Deltaproteobacteria bacterium]|nr:nitronate monooxygenase [Deltaproteobacteria bacterium]